MLRYKKTITTGYISLVVATCVNGFLISSAAAGPPIPFSGFTVNSGSISATCPVISGVDISCSDEVIDNGFLQRQVTITGGGSTSGTYLQFILTDPGATGNPSAAPFSASLGSIGFVNEEFVKMNNNAAGIASSLFIGASNFRTPTLEDRFVYTALYNFGWAQSASSPWVTVHQDISTLDYSADPQNPEELMYTTADIISNANGFNTNRDVKISQMVKLSDATTDVQKFRYTVLDGFYQATCHNSSDSTCGNPYPEVGPTPLLPGGTNGGDTSWDPFSSVYGTWVGQSVDTGTGGGASSFGMTRYEGIAQVPVYSDTTTTLVSQTDPEAINWDYPFGPPESLFDIRPVTPTQTTAPATPAGSVPTGVAASGSNPASLPIGFDAWTVSNGIISADPCTGCGDAVVSEAGMFQRPITVGGVQYFQTIITGSNATGDPTAADFATNSLAFKQENLVKANSNGVASNLNIADATSGKFEYSVLAKTGWAHGEPLDPTLEINQSVASPATNPLLESSAMWDTFYLAQGETANDKIIDITHAVGQNTPNLSDLYIISVPIMFRTNIVRGAFQGTTHTLADADLLPSSGGNIPWLPGQAIQATWLGAQYTTSDPFLEPTIIGTTAYTNLSTGDSTMYTSRVDPNPDSWVAPFLLPAPSWVSNITIP